ncbi:MAG TPA: hypothetical protein VND15_00125 [Candidatus Acidoferrales bacterium]|nr:hypothetical protein [Candidatus Acidoferrales bacterium]
MYETRYAGGVVMDIVVDHRGFKLVISKEGKDYLGDIEDLHIHDSGKSIKELISSVDEAIDLVLEVILEDPKKMSKSFPASVYEKLGLKVYA